jgi:hypothetical protein
MRLPRLHIATLAFGLLLASNASSALVDKGRYHALVDSWTDHFVDQGLLDLDIVEREAARGSLSAERKALVQVLVDEARVARFGKEARERYEASGWWCSDFARWVYLRSGAYENSPALTKEFQAIWRTTGLINLFKRHGRWIPHAEVGADTIEAGDYLPLDLNVNGIPNHSVIVVFVSRDRKILATIDGNDTSGVDARGRDRTRVSLKIRPYMIDGRLSPVIMGVGKFWAE